LYFAKSPLFKREIARHTERWGNILQAFSTYQSRQDAKDAFPLQVTSTAFNPSTVIASGSSPYSGRKKPPKALFLLNSRFFGCASTEGHIDLRHFPDADFGRNSLKGTPSSERLRNVAVIPVDQCCSPADCPLACLTTVKATCEGYCFE
jgi:hypothetical protein